MTTKQAVPHADTYPVGLYGFPDENDREAVLDAAVLASNGRVRVWMPNKVARPWFVLTGENNPSVHIAAAGTPVDAHPKPPEWQPVGTIQSNIVLYAGKLADALHELWARGLVRIAPDGDRS